MKLLPVKSLVILFTAILLSGAGRPPRRIMVTSALPGEGKSSTSTNLAICLALAGRRVILVDADLQHAIAVADSQAEPLGQALVELLEQVAVTARGQPQTGPG